MNIENHDSNSKCVMYYTQWPPRLFTPTKASWQLRRSRWILSFPLYIESLRVSKRVHDKTVRLWCV